MLPNCDVELGAYTFYMCESLEEIQFATNTRLTNLSGSIFEGTMVSEFVVDDNNQYYSVQGAYVLNKDKNKIIFIVPTLSEKNIIIPDTITIIGEGAFSGLDIEQITIMNPNTVIESFAFTNCKI